MTTPSLHVIHPATILPNAFMGFNVYLAHKAGEGPIKFISSNQCVAESDCELLRRKSPPNVFIDTSALSSYRDYLMGYSSQWMADPALPAPLKTSLLLDCVQAKLRAGYPSNDWQYLADLARDVSVPVAEFVGETGMNIVHVTSSLELDTDPMHHALRTGIYCAILGDALGYDRRTVVELCIGGLLHDIGKRKIDDEAEALSESGDRRLKAHPLIGFRRLCQLPNLPLSALMMCYQHHECIDGSGYPAQRLEDEIHFAARVCAIANRFDHLTTNDNPRLAYSPGSAVRIFEQDKSNRFDSEMMKVWLKLLKTHLKNS